MNWILLIVAGLFEVAFAACLGKAKEASGIETTYWHIGFLICLAISGYFGDVMPLISVILCHFFRSPLCHVIGFRLGGVVGSFVS
jgi:hypothetical protein